MVDHVYLSVPTIDREKFPGQLTFVEGNATPAIEDFRRVNWLAANELSFPGNKDEDWRWVDLEQFPDVFKPARPETDIRLSYFDENNALTPIPDGLILIHQKTAHRQQPARWVDLAGKTIDTKTDKFASMAAALADNGVLIYVAKNVILPGTILVEVDYGMLSGSAFSHHLLHLEEGASATVILRMTGAAAESPAFISDLFEISLTTGATLNLIELQALPRNVWQISHEKATLETKASLRWTYGSLGAGTTKNFVTIDLNGEGASALARGVYFASAGQRFDLDTQQNHKAPHTTSDLLYKGAANADGKVTWEGMITVDRVAQQTDGYQANRNLILSDLAEINTIPGLEISADDVKCSHGATVGRLNDEELFYLQCRGIPLSEARTLIVQGFFAGILDGIAYEATRNEIGRIITEKLKEE
ncbi:MAG: Fe-S cluster assembly protein SufD [Anaerolineaceae bacterium]